MEEAVAMAAVSFPDDVLLEILFRVKDVIPAALFRCATACTRWRDLVTEPAFLRCCWPDQNMSSFFFGFFTQQFTRGADVLTPFFTPTLRSALFPRPRDLMSFMTATPAGVFDSAMPLVSRHGLLLVRLHTEALRGYPIPTTLDLAVCNLLTGTCHILPALEFVSVFNECNWSAYAMLTAADCFSNEEVSVLPSNSSFFKVAIVRSFDKDDMDFSLHTFSSDEQSWSVCTKCFNGEVERFKYGPSHRAVLRCGVAHWLFRYWGKLSTCLLNINMWTGHISFMKLPLQLNCYHDNQPCLTLAASGALSVLCMQKTCTKLEIWEQQEEQPNKEAGSVWLCTRKVELKKHGKSEEEGREVCVMGEKCGTLLVNDTIEGVYTADLQTGTMEEVSDWPRRGYIVPREIVPLEVDWPGIFSSRVDTSVFELPIEKETKDGTAYDVSTWLGTNVPSRKQKTKNQVTSASFQLMYLPANV